VRGAAALRGADAPRRPACRACLFCRRVGLAAPVLVSDGRQLSTLGRKRCWPPGWPRLNLPVRQRLAPDPGQVRLGPAGLSNASKEVDHVRKLLISMLPSASVVSMPQFPVARPWAVEVAGGAARKPIASVDASALHGCVEQPKHSLSGEYHALSASGAGWLGNGNSTFGNQVQTQLTFDATRAARIDGRAGSPPRGTPV
jgi:hypothetical protein